MKTHWKETVRNYRWEREDGALVRYDDRTPHSSPIHPSARMFTAWEPNPSSAYLMMRRGKERKSQNGDFSKPGFPRRWKHPESAMREVDRLHPLQTQPAPSSH